MAVFLTRRAEALLASPRLPTDPFLEIGEAIKKVIPLSSSIKPFQTAEEIDHKVQVIQKAFDRLKSKQDHQFIKTFYRLSFEFLRDYEGYEGAKKIIALVSPRRRSLSAILLGKTHVASEEKGGDGQSSKEIPIHAYFGNFYQMSQLFLKSIGEWNGIIQAAKAKEEEEKAASTHPLPKNPFVEIHKAMKLVIPLNLSYSRSIRSQTIREERDAKTEVIEKAYVELRHRLDSSFMTSFYRLSVEFINDYEKCTDSKGRGALTSPRRSLSLLSPRKAITNEQAYVRDFLMEREASIYAYFDNFYRMAQLYLRCIKERDQLAIESAHEKESRKKE